MVSNDATTNFADSSRILISPFSAKRKPQADDAGRPIHSGPRTRCVWVCGLSSLTFIVPSSQHLTTVSYFRDLRVLCGEIQLPSLNS